MSDLMLFGVLRMPYEMAMCDELSRYQFYQRAQEAADRLEAVESSQPAPQGVAEVMELVEQLDGSAALDGSRDIHPSVRTETLFDQIKDDITAIVQERDALKADKVHHEKVIENVSREAHQWWSALQGVTARAAEQANTIKSLTAGCEKYGLTETTPVVRHIAAMEARVAELDGDVARAERFARIGCAVERAAASLPEGYGLRIELETGAGSIYATNDDGNEIELPDDSSEPFGSQIETAIDAAIAASKEPSHG